MECVWSILFGEVIIYFIGTMAHSFYSKDAHSELLQCCVLMSVWHRHFVSAGDSTRMKSFPPALQLLLFLSICHPTSYFTSVLVALVLKIGYVSQSYYHHVFEV